MILAESLFPWDTVVKILGVGLSGLGFLLMYLAYQLIKQLISTPAAVQKVFTITIIYMVLCFVMTITVGTFTVINTVYKNDQLAMQTEKINNTTTLLAANQKAKTVDTLIKSHDKITPAVKKEQKKALDTIGNFVAQTKKQPIIDSFNKYRAIVVSSTEQLTKIDTNNEQGKAKFAVVKKKYEVANSNIDKLTNHVATALIKKQ